MKLIYQKQMDAEIIILPAECKYNYIIWLSYETLIKPSEKLFA